jgi:hypothetical protein
MDEVVLLLNIIGYGYTVYCANSTDSMYACMRALVAA